MGSLLSLARRGVSVLRGGASDGTITAQINDSTASGGNARGANSVDLQTTRTVNTQVASGSGAIVIGKNNTASSTGSIAVGDTNVANGFAAFALGRQAQTRNRGTVVYAAQQFAAAGDAQAVLCCPVRNSTTDATPTRLTLDGGAASTSNIVAVDDNSALFFRGLLVASTSGTAAKGWTIDGLIRRGSGVATTNMPTAAAIASAFGDAGLAAASAACTADTTNGGINVTVTGIAATNIRWVFTVSAVEVQG